MATEYDLAGEKDMFFLTTDNRCYLGSGIIQSVAAHLAAELCYSKSKFCLNYCCI